VAHSAERAIALASQWQPQVLISDIAMPEVSGYELAGRICQLPDIPRPILIALTGYGQESDRQAALAAGFEEHLTKPIGIPTLQALLERVTKRLSALVAVS
jgi:CheY-like chemotaxis protein